MQEKLLLQAKSEFLSEKYQSLQFMKSENQRLRNNIQNEKNRLTQKIRSLNRIISQLKDNQ